MSLSTFLESQNKDLRNCLYEWQEKVRQNFIVIEAKDKRIAELEELLNDTKRQNNFLFIQNGELESEVAHWKSNHDNQKALKSQLMDRPDLRDRANSIWRLHKRIAELEGKVDFPDWNQWFKDNSQPKRKEPPHNHLTHSPPQESEHPQTHEG